MLEMMKEMRLANAATTQLVIDSLKDRVAASERMVEKLMDKTATRAPVPSTEGGIPTSQVSGLVTGVNQIVSVVEKLGFRKNGVGIAQTEPSGVGAWLPDVMQAAQGIIAAGV